jgi:hypothetical protein
MQLTGVGPPPIGVGQAPTGEEQLTGVGPPPIGVGQPANSGQLTGVGPPPIGVGQPANSGQLTGVEPPPTGVGQPTWVTTKVGVGGGTETGNPPGSPVTVTSSPPNQHKVVGLAGSRMSQ